MSDGLDPARVTRLHHRSSVLRTVLYSPRFKSLKSAAIGKRTAVRMLSFEEAHEPALLPM